MRERQNTSTLGALLTILDMMISCYYYTYHFQYCSNSINKLAIMASSLQLLVNYEKFQFKTKTNKAENLLLMHRHFLMRE